MAKATKAKQPLTVDVFRGRDGWRFRIVSRNGQIVASSEAYTRKASAWRGARRVLDRKAGA